MKAVEIEGAMFDLEMDDLLTVLPEEPTSHADGSPIRHLVEEAIRQTLKEELDALEEESRELEEQGVVGDLIPPPEWLIGLGIFLIQSIASGATWDSIKKTATTLASKITKQLRDANAKDPSYSELSEVELERACRQYLERDFTKEENLYQLYRLLEKVFSERGHEFDPTEIETKQLEKIVREREARVERLKEGRLEQDRLENERRERLKQNLIDHDLEGSADESELNELCRNIDVHLINGIETQFLFPYFSEHTERAIIQIIRENEIPNDVLELFQRFQLVLQSGELTEFGRSVLSDLGSLRPSSMRSGRFVRTLFTS